MLLPHRCSDKFWARVGWSQDKKELHPMSRITKSFSNEHKDWRRQVPDPLLIVPQGSKTPCLMTLDQAPFFPCFQNFHSFKILLYLAKLHRLLHCKCPERLHKRYFIKADCLVNQNLFTLSGLLAKAALQDCLTAVSFSLFFLPFLY